MDLTRRDLLAAGAAAMALPSASAAAPDPGPMKMGIVIHSYMIRGAQEKGRFDDPIAFLEYCHTLGAAGVQVGLGARERDGAKAIRAKAEALGMYFEGMAKLPRSQSDRARFVAELKAAEVAGAGVVRAYMLLGRRYESFDSASSFRKFADEAFASLALAAEILKEEGSPVRVAVENHKDFRAGELAEMLKRIGSDRIGVCLDTGNNIALLEDPMEVVEALAPWALTTHFKDMGVQEYERGFLLSEVPLGEGFLDLPRIVRVLRRARPEIRINLEMITRDPLEVPCLTPKYWATSEDLPARHLARSLKTVRDHPPKRPLPRVAGLSREEQFKAEDENVRRCLASARDIL